MGSILAYSKITPALLLTAGLAACGDTAPSAKKPAFMFPQPYADAGHSAGDASLISGDGDLGDGDGNGDGDALGGRDSGQVPMDASQSGPDASADGGSVADSDASASSDGGTQSGDGDASPGDGDGDTASPDAGSDGDPPLPPGDAYANDWTWVEVPGSTCRNGSTAGYYYRKGTSDNLLIFLNGGGACADKFFCNLNPVDVDHNLPIEYLSHGTFDLLGGVRTQRQEAPEEGIFKRSEASNPVKDWGMVFIPYCTGDIHSGSRKDVTVEGLAGPQQFTGRINYHLFLDSFGPTFKGAKKVLLTGSSAGGFGSLFNADYTIEYFSNSKVITISDSGVPFQDGYMAPCLQKRWRDYWGLNDALPPKSECPDCYQTDGGGLVKGYGSWLFHKKYDNRMLGGFISSVEDEIIRAFYAPGLSSDGSFPGDCTMDPAGNTVQEAVLGGGPYTGAKFHEGLVDVLDNVVGREKVGYYVLPGTPHMHLWRSRFYEIAQGADLTMAEWVAEVLNEEASHQGSL